MMTIVGDAAEGVGGMTMGGAEGVETAVCGSNAAPAGCQLGLPSRRRAPFLFLITIAKPIAVGQFEVTFGEWDACVSAGDCKHKPGDENWGRGMRPVINVSWEDITREYFTALFVGSN